MKFKVLALFNIFKLFLVGSQLTKTRTINNDLNPVFNECFEAVVDQASGQKLRIQVFDEDMTGMDDELGRLSIPLEVVKNAGEVDNVSFFERFLIFFHIFFLVVSIGRLQTWRHSSSSYVA